MLIRPRWRKPAARNEAKVLKALAEVSVDGPRGSIKMDKQRHAAAHHVSRPGQGRRLGGRDPEFPERRPGRAVPAEIVRD